MDDDILICGIDTDLSIPIQIGRQALLIQGWCYHPKHNIKQLYILLDRKMYKISNFSNVRFDVYQNKKHPNSINSGFWTITQLQPTKDESSIEVSIRAVLDNGKQCELEIGLLKIRSLLEEKMPDKKSFFKEKSIMPLVTICMTTYNPPIDLFTRQINSIRRQSYVNWICIINDDCSRPDVFEKMEKVIGSDNRFCIYRNSSNLGFYYNFERCLTRVKKEETEYIAFSDQDDFWHDDKLSRCIREFDDETTLVYSDMNIVNTDGKLIYHTYWTTRKNNYKELDHLLLANTVTGAASIFHAKLLDTILPFPKKIGDSYHDWWVACVALAKGKIKYIDKPLYDYVQHSKNVLGHFTNQSKQIDFSINNLRNIFKIKQHTSNLKKYLLSGLDIYNNDFIRIVLVANTLKARCDNTSPIKSHIINQFSGFESSIYCLIYQYLKGLLTKRSTLGAEGRLLRGVLINQFIILYIRTKIVYRKCFIE